MTWHDCCYWTGSGKNYDDINPRRFDWWCPECKMAIKDRHVEDGRCPDCGEELDDIREEIDVSEELHSGEFNQMSQDEQGNWVYE